MTATWNNWKGHGRPEGFYYFGQNRKGPEALDRSAATLIVRVDTSNPSWYSYIGTSGKPVFQGGVATKFWAEPAQVHEHTETRHSSDGTAITVRYCTQVHSEDKPVPAAKKACEVCGSTIGHLPGCKTLDKPKAAKKPAKSHKLSPCRCGCKAQIHGLYKQGHDARHASDLFGLVQAGTMTSEKALGELVEGSKLQAKLIARLDKAGLLGR